MGVLDVRIGLVQEVSPGGVEPVYLGMMTQGLWALEAFMLPNLGPWEMALLLLLALLLFGKRLPEVGKALGKGIVEFKKGVKGIEDEIEVASSKPVTPAASPPAHQPLPAGGQETQAGFQESTQRDESKPENAGG